MSDDSIQYPPMSDEDVAELNRRIEDAEDPTRYMIKSDLGYSGSFILWYEVTEGTWCSDQLSGTMFKREKEASAVLTAMGDGSFTCVEPVLMDIVEASEDDEGTS